MLDFLAKKLKRRFSEEMKRHFPLLEKVRHPISPGTPVYRGRLDDIGYVFVALRISPKYNSYTLELAWSDAESHPWDARGEMSLDGGRGTSSRSALFFPGSNTDHWWNVVTGGEGYYADRPAGPLTIEKMRARLNEKVDPNMPEHVDACVADTMAKLAEILPAYMERARQEITRAAS